MKPKWLRTDKSRMSRFTMSRTAYHKFKKSKRIIRLWKLFRFVPTAHECIRQPRQVQRTRKYSKEDRIDEKKTKSSLYNRINLRCVYLQIVSTRFRRQAIDQAWGFILDSDQPDRNHGLFVIRCCQPIDWKRSADAGLCTLEYAAPVCSSRYISIRQMALWKQADVVSTCLEVTSRASRPTRRIRRL